MNKVERLVYDLVKNNPKLKQVIRNLYQKFFDLLPRKREFSINPIQYKEGFFLGFHDVQPFSASNDKVLANKLSFDLVMPKKNEFIDVGYINLVGGKLGDFVRVGRAGAWNYHKGCRLQWIDGSRLIYNSVTDKCELVSEIINIATLDKEVLPYPIDTVSPDGKLAATFSYQRLEEFMPGYGYPYEDDDAYIDQSSPKNTGLFVVDLSTSKRELVVDLETLAKLTLDEEASTSSSHYVTHSQFSHDSRYISFLHRWVGADKQRRFTKLVVYDTADKRLLHMPITNNMASHYAWNDKHQIIAYCNFEGVDCHALLDVNDLHKSRAIAYPQLNSDGHQTFVSDEVFVTDTYPDKWRMAKLFKVDIYKNAVSLVASVYSPKKFQTKSFNKHIACDLHPRASADGKHLCFDTVKSGKRALAIIDLSE